MGPVIRVPADVAQTLEEETDLVEAVVLPDAVDGFDVALGGTFGSAVLLLVETPKGGFGPLATVITASGYAQGRPSPFEMVVLDKDGNAHPFPAVDPTGPAIEDQLKLAYYGEPGDRRPLLHTSVTPPVS
jgi:hypothetical protein